MFSWRLLRRDSTRAQRLICIRHVDSINMLLLRCACGPCSSQPSATVFLPHRLTDRRCGSIAATPHASPSGYGPAPLQAVRLGLAFSTDYLQLPLPNQSTRSFPFGAAAVLLPTDCCGHVALIPL